MLKEFQEFISRGNVIDLAVAVIIGAAFTAIVNSLVADIIMPLIGIVSGGIDFTTLAINVGSATLTYGNFIQAVINFVLVALVIFLLVRTINQIQEKLARQKEVEPAASPEPSAEVKLLTEIRDLLKTK